MHEAQARDRRRFTVVTEPRARISHRLIERRDGPALEWIEAEPAGEPRGAPLLFVHGAFGGAWMFEEIFLPHLARRGRRAAAVSLRGHGRSQGGGSCATPPYPITSPT